jgi:hypothetical protein
MPKSNPDKPMLLSLAVYPLFIVVVLGLLVGLAIHLLRASPVASATIASIVFGIIVISVLLALLPYVSYIETLTFSPNRLEVRLRTIEKEASEIRETAESAFENVVKFIFLAMPGNTYQNLKKITEGNFGAFEMTDGFRSELRYLRDNGYIIVAGYVGDLPGRGDQLSTYVNATKIGREFVDFREHYSSELPYQLGSRAAVTSRGVPLTLGSQAASPE